MTEEQSRSLRERLLDARDEAAKQSGLELMRPIPAHKEGRMTEKPVYSRGEIEQEATAIEYRSTELMIKQLLSDLDKATEALDKIIDYGFDMTGFITEIAEDALKEIKTK